LVTANGPSVISVCPSRTRTDVALSVERKRWTPTSSPASRRLRCSSTNIGVTCSRSAWTAGSTSSSYTSIMY
jgi:hypothetical protein